MSEEETSSIREERYHKGNAAPLTSRMLYLLGDATSGSAYRFAHWLESVRRRRGQFRSSGFPNRLHGSTSIPLGTFDLHFKRVGEQICDSDDSASSEQIPESSLWERLGRASMLDIESNEFIWQSLSSLHHTEHNTNTESSDDEGNKALEVTVNSGGVVFFALFNISENDDTSRREAAAVIKISSSRMATQSERLGYELAKWLGVCTPQARVIHCSSPEWQHIKEAAEKARENALRESDEVGEITCSELLEALEMSRCLLLMNYIHGLPLLESPNAYNSKGVKEKTAYALGHILMLDLVIRNEDRLPCRQLGWRGNPANLLFADNVATGNVDVLDKVLDSSLRMYRPKVFKVLQKERRSVSVDSRLGLHVEHMSENSGSFPTSPRDIQSGFSAQSPPNIKKADISVVAIDSGVPRRPPAAKRAVDQNHYPKLVELVLNSINYSSNLLHEITEGKMDSPDKGLLCSADASTVNEFRAGFRSALRDLQGFHLFLLTLHQKLESHLRTFLNIINRSAYGDAEKEEIAAESPGFSFSCISPAGKEHNTNDGQGDLNDSDFQKVNSRPSSTASKESPDSASPVTRESWHGRSIKGSGDPLRGLRLTMKFRDFNKYARVDTDLSKELDQWNEMLRTDVVKLCQENNFNSGFFEGSDSNIAVDAYELKVRLEHILERIALICNASNTERPSMITGNLFIGGALAAKSVYTLQHLGISHILCLCSNEIGQSDSQCRDLFTYKNFSIFDHDDEKIGELFDEASDFIEEVDQLGKKVLVHCFEGKSRSATVILAYLMLKKNYTLQEAWNILKKVHRRAQPNDGFAKTLLELEKKLHGEVSMEWQHRKPAMKACPICGKNTGISSSSLKLHLQKSHRKISSGSIDSAMNMEIQKALDALQITRGGSISPTQQSVIDDFES